MRFIFLSIVLSACSSPPITLEDEVSASRIVWWGTYEMHRDRPPVVWVSPEHLTCSPDLLGHLRGFDSPNPAHRCVAGVTFLPLGECYVAAPEGYPISRTSFAHELAHAAIWYWRLDGDPRGAPGENPGADVTHDYAAFAPGGLLEQANAALKEAGL